MRSLTCQRCPIKGPLRNNSVQSSINRLSGSFKLYRYSNNSKAMELTKYWVVASILLATTSRSEIVISDSQEFAPAFRDLINIVTSCYGGHVDGVGISGNVPDNLVRTLAEHSIPVASIDENAKSLVPVQRIGPQFRHELRVFIVGASSVKHLWEMIVANMFYAIWFDYMASYLIIDSSPKCQNNVHFLYAAWKMNMINTKVVCLEPRGGKTVIFGFNPFTSQAPVPWEEIRVFKFQDDHPFTVFHQSCRKDEAMCVNLDFDKTADLGGSEIHIHGRPLSRDKVIKMGGPFSYRFFTTYDRVMFTILDVLNAKPKFFGSLKKHVVHEGGIRFIPTGLNFETSTEETMYPHEQSGFVVVTKFRGNKSQLNKILTVVDVNTRYGIGVVYLITLIFLKFFVHQALVPALLNLVRITCDTGFENLPNNTAARTFLTGLLFFVVTIQGIYQGNLAALLTTTIPLKNVNTMQDFVEMNYERMYSLNSVKTIIEHPYIKERYKRIRNIIDCVNFVKNDSSAACLVTVDGSIDIAVQAKLHVGNKYITPAYFAFGTRWFWPLKDRVNKIISRMVESSTLEQWDVKCHPPIFTEYEFDDDVKANVDFKNIELSEVTFAFVILGIGLVCASVTFVVELIVHRYQSRVVSVRVQFLN